jgi:hypothetical protein
MPGSMFGISTNRTRGSDSTFGEYPPKPEPNRTVPAPPDTGYGLTVFNLDICQYFEVRSCIPVANTHSTLFCSSFATHLTAIWHTVAFLVAGSWHITFVSCLQLLE